MKISVDAPKSCGLDRINGDLAATLAAFQQGDHQMKMRRLLTFDQLIEYGVVYGRRQIDRLEKNGEFPQRVTVGDNRVAWIATEITAWVNQG
jgi:prophage regulatory protein